MINKIYKIIHNKYLKFFKLFLFLKYIFLIFLIAISLFLSIPKFFNYEKKENIIKNFLIKNYQLEIVKNNLITFNAFPLPHILFKDVNLKVQNGTTIFTVQNLKIFLNIKSIYNYKNFNVKKIILLNNKATIDINAVGDLYIFFEKLNKKISIQNLNLNLKKEKNVILEVKKINYYNYGYKKNKIEGESFNKKFRVLIYDNSKKLKLKILNTGINAQFNFEEEENKNLFLVNSKINILKNYFKLKLKIFNDYIEVYDSNFRNKDLSISFDSLVKTSPYFEIDNNVYINKFNRDFLENLNLKKFLEKKEIIKKLNSNNKIIFKQKKYYNNFFKPEILNLNLANGKLDFSNKNIISGGSIDCYGNSLITDEFPRIYFNCIFNILNKKKFLKTFSISRKIDEDSFKLTVIGSLNLYNKKINFKKITSNKNYNAKEEDMIFFKGAFERILFNEGFFGIFKKNKIKDFLLEII